MVEDLHLMTVLQSSVKVMHVNLSMDTFLCLLRSSMDTQAAVLARINDNLSLKNIASSSHFSIEDSSGGGQC